MTTLGIDFGTSTSVVAVCHMGSDVEAVPDGQGDEVIPSAVAFTPAGKIQVGKPARARRLIDPVNALFSMKRILGRDWRSEDLRRFKREYPFELEQGADGVPRFVTRSGKLTPTEVVGYLMAHLREYPGIARQKLRRVVISVPASAGQKQKDGTIRAAERAGFRDVSVIEEPHAAALPYLGESPGGKNVVVYDLGGGTFDIAAMVWDGTRLHTRASGGDAYLGGDDIDRCCTNRVADQILSEHHWDVRTSTQSEQTLGFLCEQAKIRLSLADETAISLAPVDQVLTDKLVTVTRAIVESLTIDLLQRTFVHCDDVLGQAGLRPADVDIVIMAGGTSYMPVVRAGVESYFGKRPRVDLPADRVVAMGAALHAERL